MDGLSEFLGRVWWLFLLRGIAAILFGVAAFVWPAPTLTILIFLFGAFVLVDGVFGLVHAIWYRRQLRRWGLLALEGVLGIAIGALTFSAPGITAFALLMLIAAWAIVSGVLRIVVAVQVRKLIRGEWLLVAGGVFSILFGVLLVMLPQIGILTVVWLIAFYAILLGALFVFLALQMRRAASRVSYA